MASFVVITATGSGWDTGRGIREQHRWDEHAQFMDRLTDEGFVVLGGPIDNGVDDHTALLVVEAEAAETVRSRFAADPWAATDTLRIESVWPWTLWLDGR
ncbi:MAG: hypothetical protein ACRDPH_07835 [Marmoricola sp.]